MAWRVRVCGGFFWSVERFTVAHQRGQIRRLERLLQQAKDRLELTQKMLGDKKRETETYRQAFKHVGQNKDR